MTTKYHILLLGGTGICGVLFIRAALELGHQITTYVRTPSKIPNELSSNSNLSIIQGEFGDVEGLKKAAACGADILISLAGPTLGRREGTPITNALRNLYPLLLAAGTFKRFLVLSTPSYSAPEDTRSLKWFISINFYIRIIGGDSYKEIRGIAQETVALGENIDWTVFRMGLLHGKDLVERGDINACLVGDKHGADGIHLERGRLVKWILTELQERKWIRSCPLLSNA